LSGARQRRLAAIERDRNVDDLLEKLHDAFHSDVFGEMCMNSKEFWAFRAFANPNKDRFR
jgi:hypothetical protein